MIEVTINDGKYTLVYDPARNDKLVAVKRNGEPWLFESQITTTLGYSNWLHAVIAEVKELHHTAKNYSCGVCKTTDRTRYMTCNRPICPDGRDQ